MDLLRVNSLTKTFGAIVANDKACLDVEPGEVHAILGENGAGKTTMMNCIYGLYAPDAGEILFGGKKLERNHSISNSIEAGIGMVHQHFMLVHNMTVLENIMLGLKSTRPPILDKKKVAKALNALMEESHIRVDLNKPIYDLSVGVQQKVEILKALYRKSRLLILDEPTAVLTPQEAEELFDFMRKFVAKGNSVVLITHKIDEIMHIGDRVTVMRAGKNVGSYRTKDIPHANELAYLMVGQKIDLTVKNVQSADGARKEKLRVEHLTVRDRWGINVVDDVSFSLREGEILGVAGVSGNGQLELAQALTGLMESHGGKIFLGEEDVTRLRPRALQKRGVRHIPEDRHRRGLIMDYTVRENLILGRHRDAPFSRKGRLDQRHITRFAEEKMRDYGIKAPGVQTKARTLSGGNQQKIILARELAVCPEVLVAVQPTRGLDVQATKFVQNQIVAAKRAGTAVLYISTELKEIMELSDRVMVFYKGQNVAVLDAKTADTWNVGLLMAGKRIPAGGMNKNKGAADETMESN
ncbi:MAG: ABC transporter ATP-binding protein [Bacillota bacterium]